MRKCFLTVLSCLIFSYFQVAGQIDSPENRVIITDTSENREILTTGRVGLNTPVPSGEFHIVGNENISQLIIDANSSQSLWNPLIRLRSSSGTDLLYIHSDGPENTFVGLNAGVSNNFVQDEQGDYNTFLGSHTGFLNSSGAFNTAVGAKALYYNSTASLNTAVGARALLNNSTGGSNVALGYASLSANNSGGENTAVGSGALAANNAGNNNTALGSGALTSNIAGHGATAIGYNAMRFSSNSEYTFDNYNVAVGYEALRGSSSPDLNTGNDNTAVGYQSMFNNSTGSDNIAVGKRAIYSGNSGSNNTAIGSDALYQNQSGSYNVAIGNNALNNNSTASSNTAVGYGSLHFNNGNSNSALGYEALVTNSGSYNVAVGKGALHSNWTGNYNVAIGRDALYNTVIGSDNTAIGDIAGYGQFGVSLTSCTILGSTSNLDVSRSNVTMVGAYISNGQCTGNNQVLLGNTSVAEIRAQVTSITAYSDGRFKTNVRKDVPGLDFIVKLNPVTYNVLPSEMHSFWGTPDSVLRKIDHSQVERTRYIGFIAQDVEKAVNEIGFDFPGIDVPENENEVYSLRYVDFIMPLVKAVQEQQLQIEELKSENEDLRKKIEKIVLTLNQK